jgi:tetratricopeptide (TPR) repeat protein
LKKNPNIKIRINKMGSRNSLYCCFLVFLVFFQACSLSCAPPEPAEELDAAFKGYFESSITGDYSLRTASLKRLHRAMESGKLNDKQLGVAYYIRGFSHYGGVLTPYEDYGKAIADFNKSIELYPNFKGESMYGTAATRCAMAYEDRGEKYWADEKPEKALQDASKAIEICPTWIGGYMLRGRLFRSKNLYDLALADFDKAIENHVSPIAYYFRGFTWLNKGNYDAAIADFTKAIEVFDRVNVEVTYSNGKGPGKYHKAYYGRAISYEKKGELKKALADAEIAFEVQPNENEYQLLLNHIKNRINP